MQTPATKIQIQDTNRAVNQLGLREWGRYLWNRLLNSTHLYHSVVLFRCTNVKSDYNLLKTFEKRPLLLNLGVWLKFYRNAPCSSRPLGRERGELLKNEKIFTGKPVHLGGKASILEILNVCLWLKFSPSLTLSKIEHFSKVLKF